MRAILYCYIAAYLLFAMWGLIEDVRYKEPWWSIVTDLLLSALALAGMILYAFDIRSATLVSTWKVVSGVLVIGQVGSNIYDRHRIIAGQDPSVDAARITRRSIILSDLFTYALIAPALILNLVYAYF
ncbi:MAG TPA: hypothetical protein VGJ37_12300 [Pyrinomonadaceae bacterium]|jgi:hypothetical protein